MRAIAALASVLVLAAASGAGVHAAPSRTMQVSPPARTGESISTPTRSPDGSRIAWAQLKYFGFQQIWVAAADGSHAHPLGEPIDGLGQLSWLSAKGLVYWTNFNLIRLTTGGRRSLISSVPGFFAFSTDKRGRYVASGSPGCPMCDGPVVIYDVASGVVLQRIGGAGEADLDPSLSPAGSQVAYARYLCDESAGECNRDTGIWVAPTKGGEANQVTPHGNCPRWSPDGRTIAYVDKAKSVRLVPPSGGRITLVIRNVSCKLGVPPSWSPDARRLAVLQGVRDQLVIVDLPSRHARVVPRFARGVVNGFSWSLDSSTLLVVSSTTARGCPSLWKVDARSARASPIRRC